MLPVIAFHIGLPVPGGFTGVDVFFVISGYVITSSIMKSPNGFTMRSLPEFYWRRFKRLIPALGLMVTATLVLSVFILTPEGGLGVTARTGVGAMLPFANFVIARSIWGAILTHPWRPTRS